MQHGFQSRNGGWEVGAGGWGMGDGACGDKWGSAFVRHGNRLWWAQRDRTEATQEEELERRGED